MQAREAIAALVMMAQDMVEAGAGAWDAEEFVPYLSYLIGAMTVEKKKEKMERSGFCLFST